MESNALRLYKHFKENGMVMEADQILERYPHFEDKPKAEKNKKSE